MNYLAHFHLAWPEDGLVAGALEGDFLKGLLKGELPESIERGVKLHRAIDAYTDEHPIIAQLRIEFPPALRRYAGIIIDVSFDHYLSKHWHRYNEQDLNQFSTQIYSKLLQQEHHLSAGSQAMLMRLVKHDVLGLYQDWQAVTDTVGRIGERLTRANPLKEIAPQVEPLREKLEHSFIDFYPELQAFCRQQRRALN